MIEEIKNEIIDLTPLFGNKEGVCVLRKEVFEILDKYNNQQTLATLKDFENVSNNSIDYQSAWEELKKDKLVKEYLSEYMQELEQKYKLGGE